MVKIGIIGGSGLNDPKWLKDQKDMTINTKYGEPSSPLACGLINGVEVAILSRHGRRHTIPPSQVNYRANINALKMHGCTHILATTACGSLRDHIKPGDFVVVDQFIDFTKRRVTTFHEEFAGGSENAVHTPMADPFDSKLRKILIESGRGLNYALHDKGTVVTIEGPRFSTRAESNMFRIIGADVINMTLAIDAILANEAQIPIAAVAMSTDYDCWKTDIAPVTAEEVFKTFAKNVGNIQNLLFSALDKIRDGALN
jgi:5'-methylthioadenosine phosphorylase